MNKETIPQVYLNIIEEISQLKKNKHTINWNQFNQLALQSFFQIKKSKNETVNPSVTQKEKEEVKSEVKLSDQTQKKKKTLTERMKKVIFQ